MQQMSATDFKVKSFKSKSSLYSPHYAEACNELRGPSPRLSAWATQLRRNVATVASRWRHCADLTGSGIEPQTSRTDNVRLATELTAGPSEKFNCEKCTRYSYSKSTTSTRTRAGTRTGPTETETLELRDRQTDRQTAYFISSQKLKY